jgi:DNA-binding NarL/FixJ family response regulator
MYDEPPVFLVVDHNCDSRFLLVKCLLRKFPNAVVQEAKDGDSAIKMARRGGLTAIISHRTTEMLGVELVEKFREADRTVPIVMVSGIDRTQPALAAGADRFLLYDEWLRIGTVVQELLAERESQGPFVHIDLPKSNRPRRI